jgi:hypothetical protein
MGIMTAFFASTPNDALSYQGLRWSDNVPADRFEVVELGGLTNLEFEMLWAMMEGVEWDPETHEFLEMETGNDETWLFQLPQRFCAKLRALDDSGISRFASEWAEIEEFGGWATDLNPILEKLRDLATLAESKSLGVFLWCSL